MGSLRIPVSQMVAQTGVSRVDPSLFSFGNTFMGAQSLSGTNTATYVSTYTNLVQAARLSNVRTGLHIYKGTLPTAADFETGTAGAGTMGGGYMTLIHATTELTYRSTDRLVKLQSVASSANVNSAAALTTPLTGGTASQSGTATWFMYVASPHGTEGYYGGTIPLYAFMGTVSAPGGGGDLEIETTDIVSGQLYRVSSVTIPLPLNFSV